MRHLHQPLLLQDSGIIAEDEVEVKQELEQREECREMSSGCNKAVTLMNQETVPAQDYRRSSQNKYKHRWGTQSLGPSTYWGTTNRRC